MLTLDCSLAQAWTEAETELLARKSAASAEVLSRRIWFCVLWLQLLLIRIAARVASWVYAALQNQAKQPNQSQQAATTPKTTENGWERESERGAGTELWQCQAYKAAQLLPLVYTQCGLLIEFEQCNALRKSLEVLVWASNGMKIEKKNWLKSFPIEYSILKYFVGSFI